MSNSILKVSDGTTTIDLLDPTVGFFLDDWTPLVPEQREVFSMSPLSDGRQMTARYLANTIDTFNLRCRSNDQNTVIYTLQNLRRLLERAVDYWKTSWQNTPVYLIARGPCETNIRYGLIYAYRTPNDDNPYAQPFYSDGPLVDGFTLVVEHTPWTENAPGTGTGIQVGGIQPTFDGFASYGRAATTAAEAYIANHCNVANISHIYVYTAVGAVWSADYSIFYPFTMLPAVPAIGDIIYFGCQTTIADSGPFTSLVFDIGTAGANYNGAWEYWNGAAWAALGVQDNTNAAGVMTGDPFDTTGVGSVHWLAPSGWATTAVNGVTGYWVRMRVTLDGTVAPTQQNRPVYAITRAGIDIDELQVGGDIPALARINLYNRSDAISTPDLGFERIIISLRSDSRGTSFTNMINLGDEQNPTGITITAVSATSSIANRISAPSGRAILFNPAGVEASTVRVRATFTTTISNHFKGAFRVFVRAEQSGGAAGDMSIKLTLENATGQTVYTSPTVYTNDTGAIEVIDCGKITIPATLGRENPSDALGQFAIEVWVGNSNAAPGDLYIYDICLMPTDEWAGDFVDQALIGGVSEIGWTSAPGTYRQFLEVDSITRPRIQITSIARLEGANQYNQFEYMPITGGQAVLQSNADQKLYFYMMQWDADDFWTGHFAMAATLQVYRNQRYLSMRGTR